MNRAKAVFLSSVLLLAQSFLPLSALSQTVPNNLDLSSTAASETARHAATINVNGNSVSVAVNDMLTPAERVAVSQVHYTGTQSIVLGADGSAVGGTFNLSAAAKNGVSSLVIPQNVTAVQDVARLANVNIVSDLVNSGTIQRIVAICKRDSWINSCPKHPKSTRSIDNFCSSIRRNSRISSGY